LNYGETGYDPAAIIADGRRVAGCAGTVGIKSDKRVEERFRKQGDEEVA